MRIMKQVWIVTAVALIAVLVCGMSLSAAQQSASPDANVAAPVNPAPLSPAADTVKSPQSDGASTERPSTLQPATPSSSRADLPHNLSPWGMFISADWVVKAVMIGLALASLITWTIWLAKAMELANARRRLRDGIAQILAAEDLGSALRAFDNVNDTSAVLVREAADEMRVSARVLDHTSANGINERVTSRLSRVEVTAGRRMTVGTGVLATIGATAPFVGLFGTVWGIMNSFIGISEAHTTNLAVVAPGIAEALLATALGLVAAIPAVIIYNVFARSITAYRQLLADASAGIERLVSRELDFRRIASGVAASSLSRAAE